MVEFTLYSYVIFTLSLWWSRTLTYWLFPPSLNGGVYHFLIISTYLHGVVYLSLSLVGNFHLTAIVESAIHTLTISISAQCKFKVSSLLELSTFCDSDYIKHLM